MNRVFTIKICAFLFFIIFNFLFPVNAQKLPNKQETSIYAPAIIKIDGKATEWNNKFEAYNNATDIFYTICNDNNNLYLTVQATDDYIINKLYGSGITFTIDLSGKKDKKQAIVITYPVWDKDNKFHANTAAKPTIKPDSPQTVRKADSFMNVVNRQMNDRSKLIRVNGVKGIDTLISVYNEDGIKAAAAFDNKMIYTLEIAIALKYLNLDTNNPAKFAYNLKIDPLKGSFDNVTRTQEMRNGHLVTVTHSLGRRLTAGNPVDDDLLKNIRSATDFSGEYTLAKKP